MLKKKLSKILFLTIGRLLPTIYPFDIVGKKFRYFCVKNFIESIGINVNIKRGASIPNTLKIGDNSGIGNDCFISDHVTIGSNVMMGPECLFYTSNHKFDVEQKKYNGFSDYKPIHIEDDVWIGSRCIFLPGVRVGKGSTIGAGAVVTKDIPEYSVAVGNPAKVVKSLIK